MISAPTPLGIYIFVFGLLIGSFLNVLIYRIPIGLDFKLKRSFCPKCEAPVRWYDNIPILSFAWLLGKCRNCKARISWRYPLVELITGVAAGQLFPSYINTHSILVFAFFFSVFCVFLVHFFIDLDHQLLPDGLNIYLAVLFLIYGLSFKSLNYMFLGAVLGAGLPLLITWLYYKWRGQIGLGGGDIKLYGVLGIYLGPYDVMMNMFLSCFLGAVIGGLYLIISKQGKDRPIAFGPFIILVASLQIFSPGSYAKLLQSLLW